mgnify:CR=1 FL=1
MLKCRQAQDGKAASSFSAWTIAVGVSLAEHHAVLEAATGDERDPAVESMIADVIRRARDHGVTVVLISHNIADVMSLTDRIIAMRLGRVEKPEKVRQYGEYIEAESRRLRRSLYVVQDVRAGDVVSVHQTSLDPGGLRAMETERLAFLMMVADGVGGGRLTR